MSRSHHSAYDEAATARCERVLVTLLGDLGPWRERTYLAGGLAPRYPIGALPEGARPHVGTTMKVFIGGSRRISHLAEDVRSRLDSIMQEELAVLIGDAHGADKAVQKYLSGCGYRNVRVFYVDDRCRNNMGNWETRAVVPQARSKNLDYFAAKDRQMAREADVGLMIWDGKSPGTLLNTIRLVANGKKAAIYEAPARRFVEIGRRSELDSLLDGCSPPLRTKIESQLRSEQGHAQTDSQAQLL